MSGQYAKKTTVPVSGSRDEIYRTLARCGATETLFHEGAGFVRIGFEFEGLRIAFPFALPTPANFTTAAGFERELRRRWRVLLLVLKTRLESVAEGAERPEEAFLPYLMLPDGSTVAQQTIPMIREAYRTGRMPESLVPGLPGGAKVIELPNRVGS